MESIILSSSAVAVPSRGTVPAHIGKAHPRQRLARRAKPLQQPRLAKGPIVRAALSTEVDRDDAQKHEEAPKPVVKIDNQHDPFATVVSIQYGNRLGELLDTTAALKNLGLNIRRAKIKKTQDEKLVINKFYITDAVTSEKVLRSSRLEEIRATIFSNLLYYHPEAQDGMAWGQKAHKPSTADPLRPLGPRKRGVSTTVRVMEDAEGSHSELFVDTPDRPGLLTAIVSTLKDLNVNVISAEVDTEGDQAKDMFYVTYHGDPLPSPMVQLVTNALQYYLSLSEVEKEESY
ncbi:hypothetical protein WJX79_008130 [Trebouxia sp. C0005]|nr:MAG: hypothetical protein FRX49_04748 [Trebouxia sp. A1-2]